SVSDSRRRVANDLFNRLTHKNADRFAVIAVSARNGGTSPASFRTLRGFSLSGSPHEPRLRFASCNRSTALGFAGGRPADDCLTICGDIMYHRQVASRPARAHADAWFRARRNHTTIDTP
ncbi:hypothetical protein, partial [Burkholderia ubonensis]|uniref:hypothetical protein n=1 Tax=Burkholderia ubonensis TaxID=101571 RepID=UPI001E6534C6